MATTIDGVYIGQITILEREGQRTGIYKTPTRERVEVTPLRLAGDMQADLRVHGGADKALHHYPAENYAVLKAEAPAAADLFLPGTIGENISTRGWTEREVCIGDMFRIGSCLVQLTQPRRPCWKIDHRYGVADLSKVVARKHIAGWYYRVIETGYIQAGDEFMLMERQPNPVSVSRLWGICSEHRPDIGALAGIRDTPGLAQSWRDSLSKRIKWLQSV